MKPIQQIEIILYVDNQTQSAVKKELLEAFKTTPKPPVFHQPELEEKPVIQEKSINEQESTGDKIKRSFFDRYVDKIKDFLDNAE